MTAESRTRWPVFFPNTGHRSRRSGCRRSSPGSSASSHRTTDAADRGHARCRRCRCDSAGRRYAPNTSAREFSEASPRATARLIVGAAVEVQVGVGVGIAEQRTGVDCPAPRGSQPTMSYCSKPWVSKLVTNSVPDAPGPPGLMNSGPDAASWWPCGREGPAVTAGTPDRCSPAVPTTVAHWSPSQSVQGGLLRHVGRQVAPASPQPGRAPTARTAGKVRRSTPSAGVVDTDTSPIIHWSRTPPASPANSVRSHQPLVIQSDDERNRERLENGRHRHA